MIDLKQVLTDIVKSIVDHPDEVIVTDNTNGDTVNLTLTVAPSDMGMVIGRNGRIAKAIRVIMKAAAGFDGKKVNVEIK
ncbi:MAG TPA: KH domain-containing protein [Bacillota bacterium]|nr:KH domain-containing protein [Clostridiales bacterium]HOQ14339.1 KH domain-containing protein [Bacillota bacterium]